MTGFLFFKTIFFGRGCSRNADLRNNRKSASHICGTSLLHAGQHITLKKSITSRMGIWLNWFSLLLISRSCIWKSLIGTPETVWSTSLSFLFSPASLFTIFNDSMNARSSTWSPTGKLMSCVNRWLFSRICATCRRFRFNLGLYAKRWIIIGGTNASKAKKKGALNT